MKFDKISLKYILIISIIINIFLIISIINCSAPPRWKNVFYNKQYTALKPDNYYKNRVDTYRILNSNYKKKIMFIGDSIIDGCEWHELFANDEVNIVNRGINGDRLEGLLERIDMLLQEEPLKIVLMIGINNLQHGDTTDSILSKYKKVFSKIHRVLPQTEVIVVSILPVSKNIAQITAINSNNKISNLNQKVKDLTNRYRYEYIDVYNEFLKEGYLNDEYSYDGLHPNGNGYIILKSSINKFLNI